MKRTRTTRGLALAAALAVAALGPTGPLGEGPARAKPSEGDPAEATTSPRLDPRALLTLARAAWDEGHGQAEAALVAGEGRARRAAPGLVEALVIELAPELAPAEAGPPAEVAGLVGVALRPGLAGAADRLADARVALAEASATSSRLAFEREAIRRWAAWLGSALALHHLEDHLAVVSQDLVPLRKALADKLVTSLVVEGLEVEEQRLGAEVRAARVALAVAGRQLEAWLGPRARALTVDPGGLDPHTLAPAALSPRWTELAAALSDEPELRALAASARELGAQGDQLAAEDGPALALGATLRQVMPAAGDAETYLGLSLGLTVPLSSVRAPEAERFHAAARARELHREARAAQLARELAAREADHHAHAEALTALRDATLPALAGRVERTRAALVAGRAGIEALVLAHRDQLELHHEETRLLTALLVSALESQAMLAQLHPSARPEAP